MSKNAHQKIFPPYHAMFSLFTPILTAIEITTILVVINFLANSIRFIYSTIVNLIRFIQFITPIIVRFILITADSISWVNSKIDWQFVTQTIIETLKSIAAIVYTAGEFTGAKFYKWHANHVGVIDYNQPEITIVDNNNQPEIEIVVNSNQPAIVNPLFVINEDLQILTIKKISQFQSAPKRIKKQSLINSYLELAAL